MARRPIASYGIAMVVGIIVSGCAGGGSTDDSVVDLASVSVVGTATTESDPTTVPLEPSTTLAPRVAVFDFPTDDDVRDWSVVNDTVMGGVSQGQVSWENEALVFTGDLSLDNNGGFASVRSPFVDPTAVAPWADRDGMTVESRGDGRTWTVEVRMDGDDGGWISEITPSADQFVEIDRPWASFEPVTRFLDPRQANELLDPARIVSIAFYLVDGLEAPFRLELRSIF